MHVQTQYFNAKKTQIHEKATVDTNFYSFNFNLLTPSWTVKPEFLHKNRSIDSPTRTWEMGLFQIYCRFLESSGLNLMAASNLISKFYLFGQQNYFFGQQFAYFFDQQNYFFDQHD
jgi:hypothetical protein